MGQVFSLFIGRHSVTKGPSSIDSLSDEELWALVDDIRDEDAIGFRDDSAECELFRRDSLVHPISDDTVMKSMYGAEPFMMSYITSHTSIPIPRIRRILQPSRELHPWALNYTPVIMDRIDGEPLATAWPNLSWWARLRVIWTIRGYIRQLWAIPIPYPDKPGPFDDLGRRYTSQGFFFTRDGVEPCDSYSEFADWYDRRRYAAMVRWHQRTGEILACPKFDRNQPFVVCHGDMKAANIIIDRKGVPWIIDFGEAGVYPIWIEYAKAAVHFIPQASPSGRPPWLWQWATKFVFGDYGKIFYDYIYVLGEAGVWDRDAIDYPPDYFRRLGMDVE